MSINYFLVICLALTIGLMKSVIMVQTITNPVTYNLRNGNQPHTQECEDKFQVQYWDYHKDFWQFDIKMCLARYESILNISFEIIQHQATIYKLQLGRKCPAILSYPRVVSIIQSLKKLIFCSLHLAMVPKDTL